MVCITKKMVCSRQQTLPPALWPGRKDYRQRSYFQNTSRKSSGVHALPRASETPSIQSQYPPHLPYPSCTAAASSETCPRTDPEPGTATFLLPLLSRQPTTVGQSHPQPQQRRTVLL